MEKKKLKKNIILKCGTDLFLPIMIMYGFYVIFHGETSPGGGFQGGVLVAASILLIYLGYGMKVLLKLFKLENMIKLEAFAVSLFVLIAFGGIFWGKYFATNVVFNIGSIVTQTATLMNDVVGLDVICGVGALLFMLLGVMNPDSEEDPVSIEQKAEESEEE